MQAYYNFLIFQTQQNDKYATTGSVLPAEEVTQVRVETKNISTGNLRSFFLPDQKFPTSSISDISKFRDNFIILLYCLEGLKTTGHELQ